MEVTPEHENESGTRQQKRKAKIDSAKMTLTKKTGEKVPLKPEKEFLLTFVDKNGMLSSNLQVKGWSHLEQIAMLEIAKSNIIMNRFTAKK